jgi:hypothetical protein
MVLTIDCANNSNSVVTTAAAAAAVLDMDMM